MTTSKQYTRIQASGAALLALLVAAALAVSEAAPALAGEGGVSLQDDETVLMDAIVDGQLGMKPAPVGPEYSLEGLWAPLPTTGEGKEESEMGGAGWIDADADPDLVSALLLGGWEAADGGWAAGQAEGPRQAPELRASVADALAEAVAEEFYREADEDEWLEEEEEEGVGFPSPAAASPSASLPAVPTATTPPQLDWQLEIEQTLTTAGPRSAAGEEQAQAQARASLDSALRSASSLAQHLRRDVEEVGEAAAAAVAAARGRGLVLPAGSTPRDSGWGIQLSFSRNESSLGLFSSPGNGTARGAFDIRAGWAKSRRLVQLPGSAAQEVVQTELYLSISGLALVCIGACLMLLAVGFCLPTDEEGEEEEEGDEEARVLVISEGLTQDAFIQASGYSKI